MVSSLVSFLFATAQASPLEARAAYDPVITRGLILPTAETLEKGEFTLSSIELLLFNFNYGITDKVDASVTSLLPVLPESPFLASLSTKIKMLEKDRWNLSLQPNSLFIFDQGQAGGTAGVQVLSDFVLDAEGRYSLTGTLSTTTLLLANAGDEYYTGDGFFFYTGVAFQGLVYKKLKLMSEIIVPALFEEGDFSVEKDFTIANAGIRVLTDNFTFDLSVIRPFFGGAFLPYLAVTGRFK